MSKPTTKPTVQPDYPGALPSADSDATPTETPQVIAPTSAPTTPTALPGTSRVEMYDPSGDPNTILFNELREQLRDLIRTTSTAMVRYYAERGALVSKALDVRLSKASSPDSRESIRASAIKTLTGDAETTYDPDSEPRPRLDVWLYVHHLCAHFPRAINLTGVKVAREFATLLTRVDPPDTNQSPETFTLRSQLSHDDVERAIERAVSEGWTLDQTRAAIDVLFGRVKVSPKKGHTVDSVDASERIAKRLAAQVKLGELDPATLVNDLLTLLGDFGWEVAEEFNAKGEPRYRLVKTGR